MPIDPLPPPPQRNDAPEDFADKGDAFLSALPAFATQAESARAQVEAAHIDVMEAAPLAIGAANYKGAYAAGTTYQIGHSCSYSNDRWVAKQINTGRTPAQNAYWERIPNIPSMSGQAGKFLSNNGSAASWGTLEGGYQEFTSSGTWNKPPAAAWVYVEAFGAGASGGASTAGTQVRAGSGGGGGERRARLFRASDLASSVTVTIGAGGASVNAPANSNVNGNDGGNSTFGAYMTARGGKGGVGGAANLQALGGASGDGNAPLLPTAAVVLQPPGANATAGGSYQGSSVVVAPAPAGVGGGGGGVAQTSNAGQATSTAGGASAQAGSGGAGGAATASNTTATAGEFPAGGGGGASAQSAYTATSGAGGNGVVRIWWW